MHCQSKLQLYAKWSCISGALWVAVPGNKHPGGHSTLLPSKGLPCYTAQTEKFEECFLAREAICAWHGAVQATSLSSLPHQASCRIRNRRVIQRSEVKSVSWCASGVSSCFQTLHTEALPGAYGKAADQPLIPNNLGAMDRCVKRQLWAVTKSTYYLHQSLWFTCPVFQNITGGLLKQKLIFREENWKMQSWRTALKCILKIEIRQFIMREDLWLLLLWSG